MKPTWSKFWEEYPDYWNYPKPEDVKKLIGGEVAEDWITNTCAIRMSRGLNYSGVPVPAKFAGLVTVKGSDGKRYGIRVREMRKWLPTVLGQPVFDLTKKQGEAFDKTTLGTYKGILAFDIHFADATGHLDAWLGTSFSHEYAAQEYWSAATRITLWSLG